MWVSAEEDRIDPAPRDDAGVIEIERWIEARPETVFSYFTDPQRFADWQGQDASVSPRPGGSFRVGTGRSGTVRGAFLEVVAPRRLVFTWSWQGIAGADPGLATVLAGATVVEISLEPHRGGTLVRLRQEL